MFGISGTELLIVVVFVLLIFGPDNLPKFGRTVGQMMREFKRAQETMEAVIRAEVYSDKRSDADLVDLEEDDVDQDGKPVTRASREPGAPLLIDDMAPDDEDEEEEE